MRNLDNASAEFQRTGLVYTVDKATGEIRPINLHLYHLCQEEHLLGGYDVQITERGARAAQLRVWGQLAGRN